MGWFQTLKDNRDWLLNSALGVVADSVSAVGTVATSIAGFVFTSSFMVDSDISVSYFVKGNLDAYGKISAILETPAGQTSGEFQQDANQQQELQDEQGFNLTDYLNPGNMRLFAYVTFAGGVALKNIGANLQLRLRSRKDKKQFNHLELTMPSWLEYGYQTAGSFIGSVAIVTGTASLSGLFYHFMEISNFKYQYTMPLIGEELLSPASYQGPLKHDTIRFNYAEKIQFNFSASQGLDFNIPTTSIILQPAINATVDFIYGAGVFIVNNANTSAILILPFIAAPLIYQGSCFFNNKVEDLRLERIENSNEIDLVDEESSRSDELEQEINTSTSFCV